MRIGYFKHWSQPPWSFVKFLQSEGYQIEKIDYSQKDYLENTMSFSLNKTVSMTMWKTTNSTSANESNAAAAPAESVDLSPFAGA